MKIDDIKQIEIEAEFQKAVSYYMIVTGTSPVSRLYVKNTTEEDIEDVRVEIISEPAFTMPFCVETTLPRLSTIKFEPENLLSPLFTVALNARTQGRIVVRVSSGKTRPRRDGSGSRGACLRRMRFFLAPRFARGVRFAFVRAARAFG